MRLFSDFQYSGISHANPEPSSMDLSATKAEQGEQYGGVDEAAGDELASPSVLTPPEEPAHLRVRVHIAWKWVAQVVWNQSSGRPLLSSDPYHSPVSLANLSKTRAEY